MKKVMFLLLCALALVSCEQEDVKFEFQTGSNEDESPLTRSASDVPAAIDQLDGIPVNIKSVATGKYLSAEAEGMSIYLAPSDDGSLLQRWNLKLKYNDLYHAYLTLIGGNSSYPGGQINIAILGDSYVPQLWFAHNPTNINVFNSGDGITYNIVTIGDTSFPPPFPPIYRYLQPKNVNSAQIIADYDNYKGDLIKWEIIPVDEFRIEEITYDLTTNDQLTVIPTQIANKIFVNDTDLPATRVISFQESVTNESSFSDTEELRVNISTSTSAKIGIASFIEGNFSMGASVDKSWSYTVGGKETKSYTISESITQEVPPRTTIKAELVATKYDADLTYIAKMYGINTGKTIYLKGKWKGAIVQESKIVLTQENKVLKIIKVIPK